MVDSSPASNSSYRYSLQELVYRSSVEVGRKGPRGSDRITTSAKAQERTGGPSRFRTWLRRRREPGVATKSVDPTRIRANHREDPASRTVSECGSATCLCRHVGAGQQKQSLGFLKVLFRTETGRLFFHSGNLASHAELTPCPRVLACESRCRDCVTNLTVPRSEGRASKYEHEK